MTALSALSHASRENRSPQTVEMVLRERSAAKRVPSLSQGKLSGRASLDSDQARQQFPEKSNDIVVAQACDG